jgi:hypothetical protein
MQNADADCDDESTYRDFITGRVGLISFYQALIFDIIPGFLPANAVCLVVPCTQAEVEDGIEPMAGTDT